jgi:hypothetical protein
VIVPIRTDRYGFVGSFTAETVVRASKYTDKRKADALPARRSSWREVLQALPATGTRVDVTTGAKVAEVRGTGQFSEIE